jgi:hypothetical protein
MQHIAAIQTRFKGYLFRSRLEARWAVFFDRCRAQFVYEAEGFRLPSGPYLPDFYLPRQGLFVEIKPVSMLPTRNFEFGQDNPYPIDDVFPLELNLIYELAKATGLVGCVMYGDPFDVLDFHDSLGGAVIAFPKQGLQSSPCWHLFFQNTEEAAIAAREARFEHGATP